MYIESIINPIVSIYCSSIWQTSVSIPSIKASIIHKVAYLTWFYNKLEVSNSAISKEIKLHLLLLLGLPSECGLYNISSVLTPFTLNYLAAVKTNQSYYSTVSYVTIPLKVSCISFEIYGSTKFICIIYLIQLSPLWAILQTQETQIIWCWTLNIYKYQ